MGRAVAFFLYLMQASIKASIRKRTAFLIELVAITFNNLAFLALWWIFFRQFDEIAGWNFDDMTFMLAVATGSSGLMQVCFGGVRTLSKTILEGDLDPFMTKPRNLLLYTTVSRSLSKGWGNLLTAALLLLFKHPAGLYSLPLAACSILCGGLVFTSINIMAHSLPFWLGSVSGLSKKYCDALFLFTQYPTNVYSGVLQILMFTLIPAGVISYLPVALLHEFSWVGLIFLITSAALFFLIAYGVFYTGLKRYTSGNKGGIWL